MVSNYLQGPINQANQSKNPYINGMSRYPTVFTAPPMTPKTPALPTASLLNATADRMAGPPAARTVAAAAGLPDFMAQAAAMLQPVDYSSSAEQFEATAAKARSRIAAMYKALKGERKAATDIYQGYRDDAKASIDASAEQAAADIAAGYDSTNQLRSEEMAALGIADALAQSASVNMNEDRAYNTGAAAELGKSYSSANELGRAADLAYNEGMIGAAGFASAEGQAQIDQQLSNLLANLAMKQQEANAQSPAQQLNYAQGLQSMYQSQQPVGLTAAEQLDAEKYKSSLKDSERNAFLTILEGYQRNNDPEAFAKAAADMARLKTTGLFG